MAHFTDLPREILVYIFKLYLETESQKDFVYSLSKVCKDWNFVCMDSSFWRKFEGTLPESYLYKYSKQGCLVQTEELIYSSSKKLKQSRTEEIFAGLPQLKSVNFSKVAILDSSTLSCLSNHCKNIQDIKFSENANGADYIINEKLLGNFVKVNGFNLRTLDLSNSVMSGFRQFLTEVAFSCPNIEQLMIQNIKHAGTASFPFDLFQEYCPKIKVLRLGFPITFLMYKNTNLAGFPSLEVFTHPSCEDIYFLDGNLSNILFNSPNLKVLDIRGCRYLTVDGVLSIPATHLEDLYISKSGLCICERVTEVISRWKSSLRVLDISRTKAGYVNIDSVLTNFSSNGILANLERLDLSNTTVSAAIVVKLIENCEKLTSLNLTSCRRVGRGKMRDHCGKLALEQLLRSLSEDTE